MMDEVAEQGVKMYDCSMCDSPVIIVTVRGMCVRTSLTCHCSSAAVSDGDGPMAQACQASVIGYLARGIDWNGRMSVNVFLKCL